MNEIGKTTTARESLLARALGPGEPELSCEECFTQLDLYVEPALTDAQPDARVPGMRAHLEGCPACAEDYRSLRDLLTKEEAGGAQ